MNEKLNRQIINVLTQAGPSTADQLHESLKQSRQSIMAALDDLDDTGAITRVFDVGLNCSIFSLPSQITPAAEPRLVKAPEPIVQTAPSKRGRPVKAPEPKPVVANPLQEPVLGYADKEAPTINTDELSDDQKVTVLKKMKAVVKTHRTKPFTPNPTRGYEAKNGCVKIFLERRACSRTLTLTLDDLKELLRAAEKAA